MLKDLLNKAMNESSKDLEMINLTGSEVEFKSGTITIQVVNAVDLSNSHEYSSTKTAVLIYSNKKKPGQPDEAAADYCLVAGCPHSTPKFLSELKPKTLEDLCEILSIFKYKISDSTVEESLPEGLKNNSHPAVVDLKNFYSKYLK